MPPSFAEAIHLVSSSSAAGCVLHAGAQRARIRGSDDRLTIGPCDVDPVRHEELRSSWDKEGFHHRLGLKELRAAIAGDAPVVLWGTRAYSDLVWLWWELDALRRIGAEGERFFLARPSPQDPQETTGGSTPADARIALDAAKLISGEEWREGSDLWLKFASPSPLAFDEARQRGSSAFPELTSSAELHGAWFPRLADGRLRLSDIDEDLLGALDGSWRGIQDLFGRLPQERFERVARRFHPYIAIYRLRDWASRGALEREELVDDNPWAQDRFRANDRTRALLRRGLDNVGDAPQLYVGGCVVNDPTSPWVRIEDASGWHLAPA